MRSSSATNRALSGRRQALFPRSTNHRYEEFAGAPTASGEPYDPDGFTAAHPYLPFGTELAVSYQGRSVTVRINDRIPYGGDYELDLSQAAAQDIGITGVGTAVVDVEVLET